MAKAFPDQYTMHGAGALADAIQAFWHKAGHTSVRAERYELPGPLAGLWGVRSNLVAGMPPVLPPVLGTVT